MTARRVAIIGSGHAGLLCAHGLHRAGHDVTVLHLLDAAERDLDVAGEALFVDPETGDEVPATPAEVRDAYRATVEEAIAEWRALCAAAGAGYELFDTSMPFGVPLRRAFSAREAIAR